MTPNPSGLVLLEKPAGITSFRCLGSLKKKMGTKKVGHTGTLDSFATGLMIVLAGDYTRLARFFNDLDKEYEAVIRFGAQTDTLDPTGRVTAQAPVPDHELILEKLPELTGEIDQVPPAFSAVHINGKRAYKRTLDGEQVDIPARRIQIFSLDVLEYADALLHIRVHCSKGTYIRSLARDLGLLCGSAAHLHSLKRTRVGQFSVEQAVTPEEFAVERNLTASADILRGLPEFELVEVLPSAVARILQGKPLRESYFVNPPIHHGLLALHDREKRLLAVAQGESGGFSYCMVLANSSITSG